MDPVTRALSIYFFMLLVFRIAGKRSLSQITAFDFILLLIIGEATQQALLGSDYSLTNALIVISTLVGANYIMALLKDRFSVIDRIVDGVPLVVVQDGKLLEKRIKRAGLDRKDILEAARTKHGIASIEEIRYAIQERDGKLSIIPFPKS